MIFGYTRVSTQDQSEQRQINALKDYCKELHDKNIYTDKLSGKDFNRPKYQELRKILRTGDILIIKELDRLGRNKEEIKNELAYFKDKNVRVKILNIPTTLMDLPEEQNWIFEMLNNILVEVLGAIAEEERVKIRKRQQEGIEIAKKLGKYKGRKQNPVPKDFKKIYKQWKDGSISATQFAKLMNFKSKTTLYKYIKRYEEGEDN